MSKFLAIFLPLTVIFPSDGYSSEINVLNVVVFPAPFTPSKAKHSP
jgi:hypothetical protein